MRVLNRPLALLLAAALLVTGIVVIVEVIAFAVGSRPAIVPWQSWSHWAQTTRWNRAVVKVWAVILIVVGLVLLLAQLKPRRATRVELAGGDEHTDAAMTKKGLAGSVRAAVLDVDGVAKAATQVTRRRVVVNATATAQHVEAAKELAEPVKAAAQAHVDSLDLRRSMKVRSTVRGART